MFPKGPVRLECPRVALMYRLTKFYFDATPNHLNDERSINQTKEHIRERFGEGDLEAKFARWKEAARVHIRLVDEYTDQIGELEKGYIQGLDFISMTGAVVLVERILNRVVFALLEDHKRSPHYKRLYGKDKKLQNWDLLRAALTDWKILSTDQGKLVERLHRLRNDSVHYIPGYDFKAGAIKAISETLELVDSIFNVQQRSDLFWLFTVPGEIWLRTAVVKQPFARIFAVPACTRFSVLTAFGDVEVPEDAALPLGPLSDEEFLKLRSELTGGVGAPAKAKAPRTQSVELSRGTSITVIFR